PPAHPWRARRPAPRTVRGRHAGGVRVRPWTRVVAGRRRRDVRAAPDRRQAGRLDLATGEFVPFANDDRGNTHGPWPDPSGEVLLVHSDRDGRWGLHELPLDGG